MLLRLSSVLSVLFSVMNFHEISSVYAKSESKCGKQNVFIPLVHNPNANSSQVRKGEFPWFVQM